MILTALFRRLCRPVFRCAMPSPETQACPWCWRTIQPLAVPLRVGCEEDCLVGPYGRWWTMRGGSDPVPQQEEG